MRRSKDKIDELGDAVDFLRHRVETAEKQIEQWKDASGLECGGDPDGVTPAKAKEFWAAEVKRIEAFQAQAIEYQFDTKTCTDGTACYVCGARATCVYFRPLWPLCDAHYLRPFWPLCDAHADDLFSAVDAAVRRLRDERRKSRPDPRQTSLELDDDSSRD